MIPLSPVDVPSRRSDAKLTAFVLSLALTALLLPACTTAGYRTIDFHVSAGSGNDEWSGRLAAPNAEASDGPFATLQRAKQAVRNYESPGDGAEAADGVTDGGNGRSARTGEAPAPAIRVILHDEKYEAPEGLTFTNADVPDGIRSVTWMSGPGGTATIVGGRSLTGWKPMKPGSPIMQWRGDLPEQANQLLASGRRTTPARYPNRDYLPAVRFGDDDTDEETLKVRFRYRTNDFASEESPDKPDPATWDVSTAEVVIWPRIDWFSFRRRIVALDPQTRAITLDEPVRYPIRWRNRYYIANVLALLDRPGESHIDTGRGLVHYWPNGDVGDTVIVTAPALIAIRGDSPDEPVADLHFQDIDLESAAGDVVYVTNARDCSVMRSRISNAGRHGVFIEGAARGVYIAHNLIAYAGHDGVRIQGELGDDPQASNVNGNHSIHNNHIHHVGRRVGHGAGVQISQSETNAVTHNHIHHSPRYGVNISGLRYQLLREAQPSVTWENHYDYLHARGNVVAYNHIHHCVLDSADAGGIAAWGAGRDNIVEQNLVHNIGNTRSYNTHGIFLDDGVDHWRVRKNIVWGLIGQSDENEAAFIKGIGHVVENNILIVDQNTRAGLATHYYEMTGEVTRDLVWRRNIIAIETDRGAAYHFWNWEDDRLAVCDDNLIHAPHTDALVEGGPADGDFSKWRRLFEGKFDQHTLTADPQFVDPLRRDYRLKPTSPAFELGFEPIEVDRIGLTEGFPARLRD